MASLELSHKLIAPFLVPFLISTPHFFLIEDIVSCSIAIFHCDIYIYLYIYYICVCERDLKGIIINNNNNNYKQ